MTTEAQSKREERAAKKRQRVLDKLLKERAKLSEMEQARLTVEAFENQIALLLTVHRESSPTVDWLGIYAALPPCQPRGAESANHQSQRLDWAKRQALARKVLDGDPSGYAEVLSGMSSFHELSALGESLAFQVESPRLLTCDLCVSGREAIPSEVHSLTSTGRLTSKPMPKARFHDIYQDYVCSCVLRVGREALALLPIDGIIVTATVTSSQCTQVTQSEPKDVCILSVAMTREALAALNFEHLDPSDTVENLPHRGDVLASKKSGEFTPIVPLRPDEFPVGSPSSLDIESLWASLRELRTRFQTRLKAEISPTQ